jgi:hypothetical protein
VLLSATADGAGTHRIVVYQVFPATSMTILATKNRACRRACRQKTSDEVRYVLVAKAACQRIRCRAAALATAVRIASSPIWSSFSLAMLVGRQIAI